MKCTSFEVSMVIRWIPCYQTNNCILNSLRKTIQRQYSKSTVDSFTFAFPFPLCTEASIENIPFFGCIVYLTTLIPVFRFSLCKIPNPSGSWLLFAPFPLPLSCFIFFSSPPHLSSLCSFLFFSGPLSPLHFRLPSLQISRQNSCRTCMVYQFTAYHHRPKKHLNPLQLCASMCNIDIHIHQTNSPLQLFLCFPPPSQPAISCSTSGLFM